MKILNDDLFKVIYGGVLKCECREDAGGAGVTQISVQERPDDCRNFCCKPVKIGKIWFAGELADGLYLFIMQRPTYYGFCNDRKIYVL